MEAAKRNARLVVWVDDRTRQLMVEMDGVTNECAGRGMLYSGIHCGALMFSVFVFARARRAGERIAADPAAHALVRDLERRLTDPG